MLSMLVSFGTMSPTAGCQGCQASANKVHFFLQ